MENTAGRIGKALPVEALGDIPAIAVARALEAWAWAIERGRDEQESMVRARIAFRMTSPGHGRALGQPLNDDRNRRCWMLFREGAWRWGPGRAPRPTRAEMRAALELDVALGLEEAGLQLGDEACATFRPYPGLS